MISKTRNVLANRKKFTNEQLKAIIDENPSQTNEELAKLLNVTQSAIAKRLKTIGIHRKDDENGMHAK